jgi:hypothetical protein
LLAQILEVLELGNLLLRFAQSGRVADTLRGGFASDAAGQFELSIVTGVVGPGVMAGGLTTAPDHGGNRAGPKISQVQELLDELGSVSF